MTSKLPWLSPLYLLFELAKLNWNRFKRPNDHELIISATRQVLAIWRKSNAIHRFLVATMQVIEILRLDFGRAFRFRTRVNLVFAEEASDWLGLELPKSDACIAVGHIGGRGKVLVAVGIEVNGHDLVLFIMPKNWRDIDLHILNEGRIYYQEFYLFLVIVALCFAQFCIFRYGF